MPVPEYVSVHCKPAADWLTALNDKFSETEPPFTVDPEARARDGD
jgi:hypothetical protein